MRGRPEIGALVVQTIAVDVVDKVSTRDLAMHIDPNPASRDSGFAPRVPTVAGPVRVPTVSVNEGCVGVVH